ncbi:MAG TPA: cyclic peptide export ABC transporter [Thermoanaerobaculia bacterium]|nr:cyclic peptide export ABC transporter [Thermoanaerobaculia bacterium]
MMNIVRLLSFLLRLSKEIRFSRLRIAFIAAAGIISGVASTSMIALITQILTKQGGATALLTGLFITFCVVVPVFRFISQMMLIDLTQKSLLELRLRLARSILAAPLRHLETIGPHRLLATLTNDIGVLVDSMAVIPILVMHTTIVVSCLIYLGWLSWLVLLEIAGFIVLGVVTYQLPVIRAIRHFVKARDRHNDLVKDVRALTEGTKELKMHRRRRDAFLGHMEQTAEALQKENRAGYLVFTAASSWGQTLFFVVLGLLVLLLPRLQPMDSRTLIGFTVILFQMMVPLEVVMSTLPNLGRALASARAVEDMGFNLQSEIKEQEGAAELARSAGWGRLELAGVTHRYRRENEEESFLLGPIDLTFEPGELVFLVGGNGSGKTTLAKLVLGLYAPESGEVRFAGRTIDDSNREEYREHFSAVFSDFFVFESLLGLNASSLDDDARKYLHRLHLQQKVQVKDGELSTIELSQGQRKRLALLTAYLEDRPIYLFDEWAADQDPIFKEIFYLQLLPELKARGRTVLVISHDDHYFHVADRVLKLDYGKIEADLTAEEFFDIHKPVGVRVAG